MSGPVEKRCFEPGRKCGPARGNEASAWYTVADLANSLFCLATSHFAGLLQEHNKRLPPPPAGGNSLAKALPRLAELRQLLVILEKVPMAGAQIVYLPIFLLEERLHHE